MTVHHSTQCSSSSSSVINPILATFHKQGYQSFTTPLPAPLKKVVCCASSTWFLCTNGEVFRAVPNPSCDELSHDASTRTMMHQYFVHDIVASDNHIFFLCWHKGIHHHHHSTTHNHNNNYYYSCDHNNNRKSTSKSIIFTMGVQSAYQSGLNSMNEVLAPVLHPQLNHEDFSPVISLFCGPQSTAVICDDGSVWFAGSSKGGNLGRVASSSSATYEVDRLTQFTRFEYESTIPSAIKSIALGFNHTILLTVTGECYGIGVNDAFQLGLPNDTDHNGLQLRKKHVPCLIPMPDADTFIEDVKCGNNHSMFRTSQGKVLFCGNNFHGESGLVAKVDRQCSTVRESPLVQNVLQLTREPSAVGECHDDASSVIKYSATVDDVGIVRKVSPSKVVEIATGSWHSICLTNDNRIVACGYNSKQQLFQTVDDTLQNAFAVDLFFVHNVLNQIPHLSLKVACGPEYSILYFVEDGLGRRTQELRHNLRHIQRMGKFCDLTIITNQQ